MKVEGKVFVVTGGGSGIGRALTLALLARGARVAAADINLKTLEETAALAGSPGDACRCTRSISPIGRRWRRFRRR